MRYRKATWRWAWCIVGTAVFVAVTAMWLTGCGGKEEGGPPAGVREPVETKAPEPEAVEKAPESPALQALHLMPESAAAAAVLPCPDRLYEKAVALAKRLAPEGTDIDALIAEAVAEAAAKFDVATAESFADILLAKGFDPEGSLAIFVDLRPTEEACRSLAAQLEAQKQAADTGEETPAPDGSSPAQEQEPPQRGDESETADTSVTSVEAPAFDVQPMPAIVVAAACSEATLAEKTLRDILGEMPQFAGVEPAGIEVNGVTIQDYGPAGFSYFLADGKIVFGTSLELVKEVAAPKATPIEFPYGTAAFPASEDDEFIEAIRMDRLAATLEVVGPMLPMLFPTDVPAPALNGLLQKLTTVYGKATEPVVAGVRWSDQAIEILSQFDTAKFPGILELTGKAIPLQLAKCLPKDSLAALAFCLTPESKAQMEQQWTTAMPPELQGSPQFAMAMGMAKQVVGMLGDEVALAVTGASNGFPKFVAMLNLANVEQAKGFLAMFGLGASGSAPAEQYNDIDIFQAVLPVPAPIYYGYPGNALLIASDVDEMKGMIDRVAAGASSRLLESLDPPMDPATPRYSMLFVQNGLLKQVVTPIMSGGMPSPATQNMDRIASVIREIRANKEASGSIVKGGLTVYLAPDEM